MGKKNVRKIPKSVQAKLLNIDSDLVVAGVAKKFPAQSIERGDLKNLGIGISQGNLNFVERIVPPPHVGKYSQINHEGEEIIHRDQTKITLYYRDMEAPDWHGYGTHTVSMPVKGYPRDFIAPQQKTIKIDIPNPKPGLQEYVIVFQVEEVLNRNDGNFERNLLFNLNLLQENMNSCGVMPADAQVIDYTKVVQVSWEILPPGTVEEAVERIFGGRKATQLEIEVVAERYKFFMSLKPVNLIVGSSGFQKYFGAQLREGLVVFDNVEYGNALYIMFEDWEELSQKSRIELLSGKAGSNFIRIVHKGEWEETVRKVLKAEIRKRRRYY